MSLLNVSRKTYTSAWYEQVQLSIFAYASLSFVTLTNDFFIIGIQFIILLPITTMSRYVTYKVSYFYDLNS